MNCERGALPEWRVFIVGAAARFVGRLAPRQIWPDNSTGTGVAKLVLR